MDTKTYGVLKAWRDRNNNLTIRTSGDSLVIEEEEFNDLRMLVHKEIGLRVYLLYHFKSDSRGLLDQYKPTATAFLSVENLRKQVRDIVLACKRLDTEHRAALAAFSDVGDDRTWDNFTMTYRDVELANTVPLGFGLYWDLEPSEVL